MDSNKALVLALPRGRILSEVMPLLSRVGIVPEGGFDEKDERALQFPTNVENFSIIRVRSFDVATFVAFGAAHFGIAGNDVLMEFDGGFQMRLKEVDSQSEFLNQRDGSAATAE